ncbi:minor histocompatibility protein ha-1 isoform x1 [Limosa lapponica baueri]|uniref:Minor histocompatibility protein ha-1 isoform x1 n=1 Tax=Limosa lapponica baueri TaxID=1758121 RepID=A0A2I0T043_LIMLA|nr:minor histocompatibility protein ha-1 isoform x1 [Limosa lapponica baueri]
MPILGSPEAKGMGCMVWEPGGTLPGMGQGVDGRLGRAGMWGRDVGQGCGPAFQPPSLSDPKEPQRPLAHECLGETLRILRQVINKYPLLNTLETLTAAGTLISKVKVLRMTWFQK